MNEIQKINSANGILTIIPFSSDGQDRLLLYIDEQNKLVKVCNIRGEEYLPVVERRRIGFSGDGNPIYEQKPSQLPVIEAEFRSESVDMMGGDTPPPRQQTITNNRLKPGDYGYEADGAKGEGGRPILTVDDDPGKYGDVEIVCSTKGCILGHDHKGDCVRE